MTLTDGDRVKIEAVLVGNTIHATELVLEQFPDVEIKGTASGLPSGGLSVPLAQGTTVGVVVTVAPGVTVPVVITENTKTEGGPEGIANGDTVTVDAVLKNGQLVVTEISVKKD